MADAPSRTAVPMYGLENAGISHRDRDRLVSFLEMQDGIAYVETENAESALIYVGLTNGRPFESDNTPSPIGPDTDDSVYDPDGVRDYLFELEHRDMNLSTAVSVEPYRMYMNAETVEYAIPLGHRDVNSSLDFCGILNDRRGRTTLDVRPTTRERVDAFLRVVDDQRDITPADVPALTDEVDEEIKHIIPSRAREAICEFFGFAPETTPHGNLRDAPEEVQAEYWRKRQQIALLHEEAADLIEEFDSEKATDHRETKLLDHDAYLQGVPSEWLNTE